MNHDFLSMELGSIEAAVSATLEVTHMRGTERGHDCRGALHVGLCTDADMLAHTAASSLRTVLALYACSSIRHI